MIIFCQDISFHTFIYGTLTFSLDNKIIISVEASPCFVNLCSVMFGPFDFFMGIEEIIAAEQKDQGESGERCGPFVGLSVCKYLTLATNFG